MGEWWSAPAHRARVAILHEQSIDERVVRFAEDVCEPATEAVPLFLIALQPHRRANGQKTLGLRRSLRPIALW
eukprot:6581972-Prymnesium_polylepis.2